MLIGQESLATIDGQILPCCSTTGGAVLSGALKFYRATQYADTAFTPGGAMPKACVQEVPNGAFVHSNTVVSLPDGTSYILLGCSSGQFTLTLRHAGMATEVLSNGDYSSARGSLMLSDPVHNPVAAVADTNIVIRASGHTYAFVPFYGR